MTTCSVPASDGEKALAQPVQLELPFRWEWVPQEHQAERAQQEWVHTKPLEPLTPTLTVVQEGYAWGYPLEPQEQYQALVEAVNRQPSELVLRTEPLPPKVEALWYYQPSRSTADVPGN